MCPIDGEPLYIYDSARREYYFEDTHPHGGSGVYRGITYETEGEKIDNKYIVRTKILYNDYCSGMCPPRINYYLILGKGFYFISTFSGLRNRWAKSAIYLFQASGVLMSALSQAKPQ